MNLAYHAFGFTIASEISLPGLLPCQTNKPQIDIWIKRKELSEIWNQNAPENSYFSVIDDVIMFHIPNVVYFLIQNGNEIYFSPIAKCKDDLIRLYLLGTCMGIILLQRKILPLHGSAISVDGKAYAIVGDSGAGKSTLAKAFLNKGYHLISDDVIPVTFSEEQVPLVTPSYPQQKLWIESLNHFGLESEQFKPLVERETKFSVPVFSQFASEQLPLAGIFELTKTKSDDLIFTSIKGMERFHILFNHTYRNFILSRVELIDWHFETSAKLVNKIPFYKISRPLKRFTTDEITEHILNTIINENVLIK